MGLNDFDYAELEAEHIDRIRRLERQLHAETGRDITLIAFTRGEDVPDCRADLDG